MLLLLAVGGPGPLVNFDTKTEHQPKASATANHNGGDAKLDEHKGGLGDHGEGAVMTTRSKEGVEHSTSVVRGSGADSETLGEQSFLRSLRNNTTDSI